MLPIFEWAVPRLFVHPRVKIMALLSMDSSYIFGNSFPCSVVSVFATVNYYISKYVSYFIDKSCAAHLCVGCTKAVCPPPSGNNSTFVNGLQLHIFEWFPLLFYFKVQNYFFFILRVCELLHWQNIGRPSLSGLYKSCLSTIEWNNGTFVDRPQPLTICKVIV